MASFVIVPARTISITFTIWLLFTQAAVSRRVPGGWDFDSDVGVGDGCVKLENNDKQKILRKIPADVYLTLERRDVIQEYYALTDSLYDAKRGKMDAWKCSSLYRTMYVRGHEQAFEAKSVSIYLTKTDKSNGGKILESDIKVCFVDRVNEPKYMPPNIYSDGKVLEFNKGKICREAEPKACHELGKYRKGVYGQVYDGYPDIISDKMQLPMDLLKLLEKKDLMMENMDMAALINTGDKTGFSAAHVIADFKEKFLAKGVRLFYAQKAFKGEFDLEWHHWIEYADVEVVGDKYTPTINSASTEYPQKFLTMHQQCKSGDTKMLARYIAIRAGQKEWAGCGNVAGAIGREGTKLPKCKCKGENEKVFCKDQFVASRKFDIESVLSLKDCEEHRAYCNQKPCVPPDDRP